MRSTPFLALALLLPLSAGAQSFTGLETGTVEQPFTLSVSSQNPAPYSTASVSISSATLDLANATLTVSVDGKKTYTGAAHAFPVQLGAAGKSTKVTATVLYQGSNYSQTISIQPQDVVLIAEPVSSAPPLYPGKPSVPFEGNVRVVAVANLRGSDGKTSSASTYSYSWVVDGTQKGGSSGIGRSSIIVPSPLQYRDRQVSVTVLNSSGSLVGGASLVFSAVQPSIRIYESDPLLGIRYERALTNSYAIKNAEATLYAAPFSFPTTNGAPLVQWFLSGALAQTGNAVTLRPAGSGEGSAALSVTVSGSESATASANLSVIFGAKKSTNLFGL